MPGRNPASPLACACFRSYQGRAGAAVVILPRQALPVATNVSSGPSSHVLLYRPLISCNPDAFSLTSGRFVALSRKKALHHV